MQPKIYINIPMKHILQSTGTILYYGITARGRQSVDSVRYAIIFTSLSLLQLYFFKKTVENRILSLKIVVLIAME